MSLRRSRRNTELQTDLVVRQALRDQLDDLPLTRSDPGGVTKCLHGRDSRSATQHAISVERCIRGLCRCVGAVSDERRIVAAVVGRPQLVLVESADPVEQLELVAQMRPIISGPSVAIVKWTACSTNARKTSRNASSSARAF